MAAAAAAMARPRPRDEQARAQAGSLTALIVTPGDVITADAGFMRGHGTFVDGDSGELVACVPGVVETVNKLIRVRPLRTRYVGEIGDVVVGRITEVAQKRWRVDAQSRLDAVLTLASVNLPGGVLRRKSAEDELAMRQFLTEGDVISAEVQQIYADGALGLHTRNLKYGKLGAGTFISVSCKLIKRRKNHFHTLPCGVFLILGNNGYVWVGVPPPETEEGAMETDQPAAEPEVTPSMRERIARVSNAITALAQENLAIYETSIAATYQDSLDAQVKVQDMLKIDVVQQITMRARGMDLSS